MMIDEDNVFRFQRESLDLGPLLHHLSRCFLVIGRGIIGGFRVVSVVQDAFALSFDSLRLLKMDGLQVYAHF